MPILTSKVTPAQQEQDQTPRETKGDEVQVDDSPEMFVMLLHVLLKMFGGQRYPKLSSFDSLKEEGALTEYKYVPPDSTIIYISHEWVGLEHPDPKGDQMYHLLLLLERLQRHTNYNPAVSIPSFSLTF